MNESVQLYEQELSMVTTPSPFISKADEVLIKVAYSGVCGTDLHIIKGEFPCSPSAVVLGHEFCGKVAAAGSAVHHVAVGDRVVVNPNSCCGVCRYCNRGQPHFCKTGGIQSTTGIWKNGGWSTFCKVISDLVHLLPDSIPYHLGVFCEPMSCISRGWERLQPIRYDATLLICGAGIIGELWASLFHFKGFRNFFVSEISERRRNNICHLNIDCKVVHPDQLLNQYHNARSKKNDDWGFDIIVDCTGNPKAIEQQFLFLRRGAKHVIFGCCPPNGEIKINPFEIYMKELSIIGSHINPYTFPKAIKLVQDMGERYLNYKSLGVKAFELSDYGDALDELKSSTISKAVFEINPNL